MTSLIKTQKKQLRQAMKRRLAEVNPIVLAQKSSCIREKLRSHPQVVGSQYIGLFLGNQKLVEIDTLPLLLELQNMGKQIYLPVVDLKLKRRIGKCFETFRKKNLELDVYKS